MGHVAESQRKIFPVVSATVTHCDLRSTFHAPLLSRSNWNKSVQKKITELFAETFSCSLYICADLRNDVSLQKSNSFFVLSTLNSFPLPCLFFNPPHFCNRLYLISLLLSLLVLPFFLSFSPPPLSPFFICLFVPFFIRILCLTCVVFIDQNRINFRPSSEAPLPSRCHDNPSRRCSGSAKGSAGDVEELRE